jgi:hypothetical protein
LRFLLLRIEGHSGWAEAFPFFPPAAPADRCSASPCGFALLGPLALIRREASLCLGRISGLPLPKVQRLFHPAGLSQSFIAHLMKQKYTFPTTEIKFFLS